MPKSIMWIYGRFMDVFYLTVRQGAATSIFGALGKDISVSKNNTNDCKGGKWCNHPMLPYFIPYHMPFKALGFEMLNFYAGPREGLVSLTNPSPIETSQELWEFSDKLSEAIIDRRI